MNKQSEFLKTLLRKLKEARNSRHISKESLEESLIVKPRMIMYRFLKISGFEVCRSIIDSIGVL